MTARSVAALLVMTDKEMKLNMTLMPTRRAMVAFAALVLSAVLPAFAAETAKSRCFNFDGLSPALREKSEAYLLQALDRESLFTLVAGIKPMSAGFHTLQVPRSEHLPMSRADADAIITALAGRDPSTLDDQQAGQLRRARQSVARAQALAEAEDLRTILATWRCGEQIHADLAHYAGSAGSERQLFAVVFSRPALQTLLQDKQAFFSRWGLTAAANPMEVLMAVEYAGDVSRFAGYGHLFCFPVQAVDFFAMAAASEQASGRFVSRDFRAIPTFQRQDGQFTYAVAKGAAPTPADEALQQRAGQVLEAYRQRRQQYIGPGKPGAAALLRDWMCPSDHHCSPLHSPL